MHAGHTMSSATPTSAEIEFLDDRIYEYNAERISRDDGQLLGIMIRDDNGEIVGGASGWTWAGACQILNLWVHDSLRGHGYGRLLLEAAEDEARSRGCSVVTLNSYGFQAPAFYERHGYQLAARLDDFPPGQSDHWLMKRLMP